MHKIFIIGNRGMFGTYFTFFLKKKKIKFYTSFSYKNKRIDFTKKNFLFEVLNKVNPKIIINFAGLTSIELCEKNIKLAKKINYLIPLHLMSWIRNNSKSRLIHFSTDHVYSGRGPHKETKTKIVNNYAASKKMGEMVLDLERSLILRVNFFGASNSKKKSFSDWIVNSIKNNKKINLYKNIFFNPLSFQTLSKILLILIKKPIFGIYNLGSRNGMSKFQFAKYFIRNLKKDYSNYKAINYSDLNDVKRSHDMRMNVNKIEKKLNIKLPTLKSEILKEIKIYKKLK